MPCTRQRVRDAPPNRSRHPYDRDRVHVARHGDAPSDKVCESPCVSVRLNNYRLNKYMAAVNLPSCQMRLSGKRAHAIQHLADQL